MKKTAILLIGLVALACLLVSLAPAAWAQSAPRREYDASKLSPLGAKIATMTFPPLSWHVPRVGAEIIRSVLPNGLVVYIYPDHSVPVAHVRTVFKGGRLYETAEEDQAADLLGSFLRLGGTEALTYEQLTEELDGMAVNLWGWVADETGAVSAQCLTAHLPRVLELNRDLLLHPGFREDKLDLIKMQKREEILRQKDYPGWVIETLFRSQLYGDHPYGRIARVPRIEAITKAELVQTYQRLLAPERTFLAVSGDVDAAETIALVRRLYSASDDQDPADPKAPVQRQADDWPSAHAPLPPPQKVNETFTPGFYHFEKDIPQTNIRLGHFGVKRGNPDEDAIDVMNAILGGEAFKSRIMSRVRSDEGLAYSAGSWFDTYGLEPSSFGCYAETKNEKAYRTITIMKEAMGEMIERPPSPEELRQAKETMINSFIHRWTDSSYAVAQIMDLEVYGYPADRHEKYVERIQAVTAQDVQSVAKKYLHPDKLIVVLVGKRADMKDLPADLQMTELTLPPEYLD
jgi:zinc protease